MPTLDEVRPVALRLPPSERATLAGELLASLDQVPPDARANEDWADEIIARSDALRAGEVQTVEWRQALSEIRQELSQTPPS